MRPTQPDRQPDLEVVVYGVAKTKGSTASFVPKRKDGSIVTRADGSPMVVTKNDAGDDAIAWAGAVSSACATEMQRIGLDLIRDGGVCVLDAIKGIVYNDDGQVVGLPTYKDFGDPARLELRVWRLPTTVGELVAPQVLEVNAA